MKRGIVLTLAIAALALTGCAGPAGENPAPTPTNVEVQDAGYAYVSKPVVEGTELLCFTKGTYGSTSCNWELWNKQREAKK
jgi:CBS-domain-containing membrane protein